MGSLTINFGTGLIMFVACMCLSSCAGSPQATKVSTRTKVSELKDRPDAPADPSTTTIPSIAQLEPLKSALLQAGLSEDQVGRILSEYADPTASLALNLTEVAKAITTETDLTAEQKQQAVSALFKVGENFFTNAGNASGLESFKGQFQAAVGESYAAAISSGTSTSGTTTTVPTQTTTTLPPDTTAPSAPTTLTLVTPVSSPSNVQTPTVRVAGTESLAMVRLYSDSNCSTPLSSSTAAQGLTVDITTQLLSETSYTLYANQTDAAGNASACSTASLRYIITIDTSAPAAATSLGWSQSSPSSSASVTAAWTKSASSDLNNQTIQFYADGTCTSASGSSIDLGSTSTQTRSFNGSNGTYTYKITSVDNAGNSSVSACSSAMVINGLTCPTNFVKIPANTDLGTAEFCVMKYEAKNVSGVATSQAALTPWVSIARGTNATTASSAWKACKDLGSDYDLLTNAQWQAIARNIEGVSSNWSNGSSSGSNSLNRGNSNQSAALAADASDTNGCVGITSNGDPADNCGSAWHVNKRTHTLSNGEVIWDIAGNVWEWVQDNLTSQGPDGYVSQNPANVPDASAGKLKWGPAGNYTAKNSGEYGGLGYGYLYYSRGAVLRGGGWDDGTVAGVFASFLNLDPTDPFVSVGFRCAAVGGP